MALKFTGESAAFMEQQYGTAIKCAESVRRPGIPPEQELQFVEALQAAMAERTKTLHEIIKARGGDGKPA